MLGPLMMGGLASAIANRSMDPLVAALAHDFGAPVTTAAMAISFYALPYALSQPILGPVGDHYGKAPVLRVCMWMQAICLVAVVVSPSIWVLFVARFFGGFAGAGLMPVTMAIIGDRFPVATRQLAMGRFLSASLLGMVFAACVAGLLADLVSWRAVFLIAFLIGLAAAVAVTFFLDVADPPPPRQPISVASAVAGYRRVFASRRAALCFATVFIEGVALFGVMPYVAPLLEARGAGGATEAGLILAGVGLGGIAYSLSLRFLLAWLTPGQMMFLGGLLCSAGIFALAFDAGWMLCALVFFVTGVGYLMLHNSVQTEVASLTAENRGSAFSMHSFSFFCGQGLGPICVGVGLETVGARPSLIVCGVILATLGPAMAYLFARLNRLEARAP